MRPIKSKVISTRVMPEEMRVIKRIAKKQKMRLSEYIRFIILGHISLFILLGATIPHTLAYTAPQRPYIPYKTMLAVVSAYNNLEAQTDSTPNINAMGVQVREGQIANNCLPFNTRVEIKGKTYSVTDRMNKRYDCSHIDIFMFSQSEAKKWGRQEIKVKIYSND